MTCLEHKKIKTRKRHRCFFCNLIIEKGSEAFINTCVDAGVFSKGWAHYDCSELATSEDWEGLEYGDGGNQFQGDHSHELGPLFVEWRLLECI